MTWQELDLLHDSFNNTVPGWRAAGRQLGATDIDLTQTNERQPNHTVKKACGGKLLPILRQLDSMYRKVRCNTVVQHHQAHWSPQPKAIYHTY